VAANRVALNRESAGTEADLDQIEAEMMADWREVADGMDAALATVIDGAASYEEVLERLPETLRLMPTAVLVETLVKGMFKARALGDQKDG
jgi:Protein of unknown function (DUF935)